MGWLVALWQACSRGLLTLIGGNAEAREDYKLLNDTMQKRLERAEERCDLMQRQVDAIQNEVYTLRAENALLKAKLAESEIQHMRDSQTIKELTARIDVLENGR